MNKDLIILTNNPIIKQEFEEDSCFEMVCEKELPDLLTKCMKLLEEGCELMVDPLAGYLSRPNPYHTIVLKSAFLSSSE